MSEELTLDKLSKLYEEAIELKQDDHVIIVSPKVYESLNRIVNAPWYTKLWWKICSPFWWLEDKYDK